MHAAEKTDYEKELFNKEAQLVFGGFLSLASLPLRES